MQRSFTPWILLLVLPGIASFAGSEKPAAKTTKPAEKLYPEIETALAPLAVPLGKPKFGEWLYHHKEAGQTFDEYIKSNPVRRSAQWKTIYICVIGDLTREQKEIVETTREYMEVFFETPVKMTDTIPLEKIPRSAKRLGGEFGDEQILSTYVLSDVLKPARPADALAYLAFTAIDLWPGDGWNYVFGQASLSERTGVWSMHRFGNPRHSKEEYKLCLERTMGTATHETSHILSMPHCKTHLCSLNGSNSLEEGDTKPLYLSPECQRKLCWNLQVDPVEYLKKQEAFCKKHGFDDAAEYYRQAIARLK